jgi:hypothetical protein
MADGFLNRFLAYGTAAEVAADDAPSEPTVGAGLAHLYMRYETDTGKLNIFNGTTWDAYDLSNIGGAITSSGLTMATARILGRTTASTGAIEELTVGAGLLLSGGALTASANLQTFSGIAPSANVQTLLAAANFAAFRTSLDVYSKAEVDSLIASGGGMTTACGITIDGGGSAITTGIKGDLHIPVACTITAVTMLGDTSGSIVVDIWKDSYANFPPTDADSITAAAPPTITTATKSQDTTLTGWTTSCSAGDVLRFNVDSCTDITRLQLQLTITVP